jgi:predicted dithiol-disulfide oxidoreductase (DUF899 family)
MLWAVSRAPLDKLQTYKKRMGWTFPWASSYGSEFNFDFGVGFTEQQQREDGIDYNYRRETPLRQRNAETSQADIPSRSTPDGATLFASMSGTTRQPTPESGRV